MKLTSHSWSFIYQTMFWFSSWFWYYCCTYFL